MGVTLCEPMHNVHSNLNKFAGYLESWTATPMNSEWQSYDMLSIVCETGRLIVKTGSG